MSTFSSVASAVLGRGGTGITTFDQTFAIPFSAGNRIDHKFIMPHTGENFKLTSVKARHINGTYGGGTIPTYTIAVVNMVGHGSSGGYSMLSGTASNATTSAPGAIYDCETSGHLGDQASAIVNLGITSTAHNPGANAISNQIGSGNLAQIKVDMSGDWSSSSGDPEGMLIFLKWEKA